VSVRSAAAAIACPRCGGTPELDGASGALARCGSCGVLGRIDDPEGRQRLAVLPGVSEESSWLSLEQALRERGAGAARRERAELLFVPYWRIETTVAGRVEGRRIARQQVIERVRGDDGTPIVMRREIEGPPEPVRKEIQKIHRAFIAGCPLEEYGLPTLDRHRQMPGRLKVKRRLDRLGEVVPFHPALRKEATVLDPIVTRRRAVEEADLVLGGWRDGLTRELLDGARSDTEQLDRSVVLLYYPVHLLRFALGERRATATADATDGTLVSLRLPAESSAKSDRRLVALLGLAAGCLSGAALRLALLPPALFAGADAASLRARLLVAALVLAGGTVAGLISLTRQMERAEP
jgi:hypothetical protein